MLKQWLRRTGRRVAAAALIVCMAATMAPSMILAEETANLEGLCGHHPEHTEECGYQESTPPICSHEHSEECYTVIEECTHKHTRECYPKSDDDDDDMTSPSNWKNREASCCPHICDDDTGCVTKVLNCSHEHNRECGYEEGDPGAPCGYICDICSTIEGSNQLPKEKTGKGIEESDTGLYPACADLEESSRLLDQLLAAERIVTNPETDRTTEEYQAVEAEDDALWAHVNICHICQSQLDEGGAYYEKFYEHETLANQGDGWAFDDITGTLTITSNEGFANRKKDGAVPSDDIQSAIIKEGVNEIAASAFQACKNLTNVEIQGSSVTAIGDFAFYSCFSLNTVVIPDSVTTIGNYAFYASPALNNLTIPGSVKSIGDYAFNQCTGLSSLTISDGVESIGNYAFAQCEKLKAITIPASVKSIGELAFYDSFKLSEIQFEGDAPSTIGTNCFQNLAATGTVTVPAGATTAYEAALANKGLTFGEGHWTIQEAGKGWTFNAATGTLTITGDEGFANRKENNAVPDDAIITVVINSGVTVIPDSAFLSCFRLTAAAIPGSVETIGPSAFSNCWTLSSLTIADGVTTIGSSAFDYCLELNTVTIPGSVTSIGMAAFQNCRQLNNLTIPGSVKSIGSSAFNCCDGLSSLTLSEGITTIGDYAFQKCIILNTLTIPGSVTSIGRSAFNTCTALSAIQFKGDTPPALNTGCFYYLPVTGTVTVPAGAEDAYKTALGATDLDFSDGHWTMIGVKKSYTVTLAGGGSGASGSGSGTEGSAISIYAGTMSGYTFAGWTGPVAFADAASPNTTFIMPDADVTVTATWTRNSSGGGGNGGGSGGSSGSYRECLPKGYTGATKILHSIKVPAYVEEGSWRIGEDGHWRLRAANGTDYAGGWVPAYNPYADVAREQMAFDWFLFDADGCLVTGWYTDAEGNRFYLNPVSDNRMGAMATGWLFLDGMYCYFNEDADGTRGKLLRTSETPD